ncbi:hypothetical protein [Nesterenkonia sp.]|uniref:hypothetical protein n=1 Tax=Nesterenkonia sp. TaxID=704201 RepID=UPI002606B09C|nr:hypothetical protein [Nesterenkonia sp.]
MSVAAAQSSTQSSYARIPAAFRLQFAVPSSLVWVPLMVFAGAWAIATGIAAWLTFQTEATFTAAEPFYAGASQAAMWCLLFMAAYTASHTFPFSMALSYSRRVFVIGAFLAFAVVSAAYGIAFMFGIWVERITDGFGMHAYTFDLPFLVQGEGGILGAGLLAAVVNLMLMMIGFFWSILYRRVSVPMLWTIILVLAVVTLAGATLINQADGWGSIWEWFSRQTTLSLAGWTALWTAILAVLNYVVIRKAVPTP